MKIYPILNKPGKGKYVFIFILNERAVGGTGSTVWIFRWVSKVI